MPKKKKKVALKKKTKKVSKAKPAPKKKKVLKAKTKKKPATKKPVAKKAVAKKAATPKAAKTATGERLTAFSPVFEELASWVNDGRAGSIDFEMYAAFNEQYKPSDWTRNPASDDELFTFGMDGTGGQVALWRRDASAAIESLPVVFMGSEGEVRPLATSLPGFLYLLASGLGPLEITSGDAEATPNDEMLEWVKSTFPTHKATEPDAILAEALKALSDFESHLMSSVPEA